MTRLRRASVALAGLGLAAIGFGCETPAAPARLPPYEFRQLGADTVFRWMPDAMPVRFSAPQAGRIPAYVASGIRSWERQFLYGEFTGTVVPDSGQADIIIELRGSAPPDIPTNDDSPRTACEGVTIVPPLRTNSDGALYFDEPIRITLSWYVSEDPQDVVNCLARVTTHEIGHAMGIFAHSPFPEDLMYTRPLVTHPSARDRATIQVLYHTPSDIIPYRP